MSDDLANESLGHNKLSLWERRQQYEQWLASGGRADRPMGIQTRIDDGKSTRSLRAESDAKAAAGLISPLPPGAIVRTDIGGEGNSKEISDDVRLNLAKALLPKIESADPETAERMANAANALLGPIARADAAKADDDEEVDPPVSGKRGGAQPTPPPKPGSSPLNRRDPADKGKHAADDGDDGPEEKERRAMDDDNDEGSKLTEVLSLLKGLSGRIEKLEGKKTTEDDDDDDSGSEDNPVNSATLGPEEGAPRDLVADDAKHRSDSLKRRTRVERIDEQIHDWRNEDRFFAFQARSDSVAQLWGGHAAKPMAGETLGNYKRRVVTTWQRLSPTYKDVNLKVLQKADGVAFNIAIDDILTHADAEGRRPTRVPMGTLIERTETKGGHQYTRFFGRPISWMGPMMMQGKRVKRIIERSDNGGSRTLFERL
jgi:hypothetical protein